MVHLKGIVLLVISLVVGISANGWCHCEGDLDCSGVVDGADLAIFASSLGATDCPSCTMFNMYDYLPQVDMVKTFATRHWKADGSLVEYSSTAVWDGTRILYTPSTSSTSYDEEELTETAQGFAVSYYKSYPDGSLDSEYLYDPPVIPLYPSGSKRIGESWGGGYLVTHNTYELGNKTSTQTSIETRMYTLLGVEDVTLGGSNFSCVKIYRTIGNSDHRVYWLARGMGIIKVMSSSDPWYAEFGDFGYIRELTSFEIP